MGLGLQPDAGILDGRVDGAVDAIRRASITLRSDENLSGHVAA
jgi:hypothetical protein